MSSYMFSYPWVVWIDRISLFRIMKDLLASVCSLATGSTKLYVLFFLLRFRCKFKTFLFQSYCKERKVSVYIMRICI